MSILSDYFGTSEESSDTLNFDVLPANNSCSNIVNKPVVVASASSGNQAASDMLAQQAADSKGDADLIVRPIPYNQKGGENKKYLVYFMREKYNLSCINEEECIKKVVNNRIFKRDRLIEIRNNNKISSYIIRGHKKNVFKKI
jgi:hypothetical protein